jgi:hypothetical protein
MRLGVCYAMHGVYVSGFYVNDWIYVCMLDVELILNSHRRPS